MDTTELIQPRLGIAGFRGVKPCLTIVLLLVITSGSLLVLRNPTVQLVVWKNQVTFNSVIDKVNTKSLGRPTNTVLEVQTTPANDFSTGHGAQMSHATATGITTTPKGHLESEATLKSVQILHTEEDIQVGTHKQCLADVQQQIYNIFTPFLKRASSVILVDPAYHGNIGDNLLSYGEFCLLNDLNIPHTECGVLQSGGHNKPCRKGAIAEPNSLAMYHAGGNWGDVWATMMPSRLQILDMYRSTQFSVIGMPQSLFYTNQTNENRDTEQLNSMVDKGLNITLTWRQKDSYDKASILYPKVRNILSPDMAFMIGPISHSDEYRKVGYKKVDILFLFREDHESRVSSTAKKVTIPQLLQSHNLTFRIVDWNARFQAYDLFSTNLPMRQIPKPGVFNYTKAIGSSVALFSSGRVIVTDRLHGSIFALLMNKPHIFIDQMYKKIRMTREASMGVSEACQKKNILKYDEATDVTDAIRKAIGFLQKKPN